jgi:hypothetical protein
MQNLISSGNLESSANCPIRDSYNHRNLTTMLKVVLNGVAQITEGIVPAKNAAELLETTDMNGGIQRASLRPAKKRGDRRARYGNRMVTVELAFSA